MTSQCTSRLRVWNSVTFAGHFQLGRGHDIKYSVDLTPLFCPQRKVRDLRHLLYDTFTDHCICLPTTIIFPTHPQPRLSCWSWNTLTSSTQSPLVLWIWKGSHLSLGPLPSPADQPLFQPLSQVRWEELICFSPWTLVREWFPGLASASLTVYWLPKDEETYMYSLTRCCLIHDGHNQCANEELIHIFKWNREPEPLPRGCSWTSWASESSSSAVEPKLRTRPEHYPQVQGPRGSICNVGTLSSSVLRIPSALLFPTPTIDLPFTAYIMITLSQHADQLSPRIFLSTKVPKP